MNPSNVNDDLFSLAINTLTLGIVPDLKTAVLSLISLFLIYIGLEILVTKVFGLSVSNSGNKKDTEYESFSKNKTDSGRSCLSNFTSTNKTNKD